MKQVIVEAFGGPEQLRLGRAADPSWTLSAGFPDPLI